MRADPKNDRTVTGCYPGSFDPMTVAHLAIVDASRRQCGLGRLDLILSEVTLGKEDADAPSAPERAAALARLQERRPWLAVVVTTHRLLVDIAEGYDWLVLGADKWTQVADPAWYGDSLERREHCARPGSAGCIGSAGPPGSRTD